MFGKVNNYVLIYSIDTKLIDKQFIMFVICNLINLISLLSLVL